MNYNDLPKNNKVCILAWKGLHIDTLGYYYPCCIAFDIEARKKYQKASSTNIEKDSLDNIRNNDYWKTLRQDMINGVENSICTNCWKTERLDEKSLRMILNKNLKDDLKSTNFSVDVDEEIIYWDIRNTNICNMKCVMCGPYSSSLWQSEAKQNYNKTKDYNWIPLKDITNQTKTLLVNSADEKLKVEFIKNIDKTKQIYFAGGESLINDFHYEVLEKLIEHNRTDVNLFYNTNLLRLNYKQYNVLDFWKQFERVNISASIDAIGSRAEWARYGTRWADITANTSLLNDYSNINFGLNVTSSFYTIGGIFDLLDWMKIENITGSTTFSVLEQPAHYRINILPKDYRIKISKQLKSMDLNYNLNQLLRELESDCPDNVDELRKKAKSSITALDKVRNTSIISACPELEKFWNKW